MKKSTLTLVAGLAFAGISIGVTGCSQAPAPVAAAPADTSAPAPAPAPPVVVEERRPVVVEEHRPVVVEENHPRPSVDINVRKKDDGDHASVDIHAH
jgi:hypothetical protein